jgi:hypothetical protein
MPANPQVTDEMVEKARCALRNLVGTTKLDVTDAQIKEAVRAALTAALAEMWRPIEEAPKSWRDVLLYAPDLASDWRFVCEGYFDGDASRWRSPAFETVNPTHFMPLPTPPKTGVSDDD